MIADGGHSIARKWNEELLKAIRNDVPRPTVHARNLYHSSVAMWDAWAAFDPVARGVIHNENASAQNIQAAREEAISYAVYRVLRWRFAMSPGAERTLVSLDRKMIEMGYSQAFVSTSGSSPAALGNRIAQSIIKFGLNDGANEQGGYLSTSYSPVNPALLPAIPGNPDLADPNCWQPLALEYMVDNTGRVFAGDSPDFLGPHWGAVTPFALQNSARSDYQRDGINHVVYHDPGPPPQVGGEREGDYKAGFEQVVLWSGSLDPRDGIIIDISPASRGNNRLGRNDGTGHDVNPATGRPYVPNRVPAGDYYRVLAEFWADGPNSETPPGHWFVIANYVSDQSGSDKKLAGVSSALDDLEWDVKLYLALGGAMHDAAITAWGIKGWYDYIRPLSAIRYMCGKGQSSNPQQPSWHPQGISLYPGSIELITQHSAAPGGEHQHLSGNSGEHIGKVALRAWRGPDHIGDPETSSAGVGWIRCEDWWPYQQPSYVTPPFAGYVSGHSTFSRAAAEVLTRFTGNAYFPGGMAAFDAPQNEFLEFEEGPSVDVMLQWATYYDAADECSLSRIYGGIHPPADDIPARIIGASIGSLAFEKALRFYDVSSGVTDR